MVSILGGAAGGATISIVIRAIDNYSKEFNKLDKSIKQQETGFKKLTNFLSKTGIGYGALAGAAVAFGMQSVKAAVESERAFQQFNLVLGKSADIMLRDLRRASKGMVSDFELVNAANRAMALGISKNQLPQLMEVAAARAKVFGRTVTEAFNDITIGIGRQSRLILDNLGIILDMDKTYEEYAQSIDKSSKALSENEKKQALVNAIIEDSQRLLIAQTFTTKTVTEQYQQFTAIIDNLKQGFGEMIIAQKNLIDGTSIQNEMMKQSVNEALNMEGAFEDTGNAIFTLGEQIKNTEEAIKGLITSMKDLSDIKLEGESEKDLDIAKSKARINAINLALMKEGEERQKALNELGFEQQTITKNGGKITTGASTVAIQALEEEKQRLEELRLEREVYFNDVRAVAEAENQAFINKQVNFEKSKEIFNKEREEEKQRLVDLISRRDLLKETQNDLLDGIKESGVTKDVVYNEAVLPTYEDEKKQIDELIKKTNELTEAYKKAASAKSSSGGFGSKIVSGLKAFNTAFTAGTPGSKSKKVNDAIIRPNGQVIETHPKDTLIATKNPGSMGGITIYIDSVYGMDPSQLSKALSRELSAKVSL